MPSIPLNASAVLSGLAPGGVRRPTAARRGHPVLGPALVGGALLWAYWPTVAAMADRWADDPHYSHGFLVPLFALAVLWARRDQAPRGEARADWWGLTWLAAALALRSAAAFYYYEPLDGLALLLALLGTCQLTAGRAVFRWAWPALAFLGFMLPLPFQLDSALALPLRRAATVASTYLLQTLGYPAFAEGNIIILDGRPFEVLDACNGLGMLMTFFALATAVALLSERPLADRLILVASAVPIALFANVVRITATVAASDEWGAEAADLFLHGWRGALVMMPLAVGLLWLELRLLARLLPAEDGLPLPLFDPGASSPSFRR
jgi:exosortase